MTLDAQGVDSWFGAAFLLVTGMAMFEVARRHFRAQWGVIQEEIEHELKRRETVA